jgi:hypothetical protein
MRNRIVFAAISCLLGAGVVVTSVASDSGKSRMTTKGYVAIGGNVIVLPERLQAGDRIEFFSADGKRIMSNNVGQGYLPMDFSMLPSGAYDMVVYRRGDIIAEQTVPIATGMSR